MADGRSRCNCCVVGEVAQGALAATGSTPVVAGAGAEAATPIAKASVEAVAKAALQQMSWVSRGSVSSCRRVCSGGSRVW